MAKVAAHPKVQPGGLVTVALLKALLDEGRDHLGMFMPLVLDVVAECRIQSFTTADIQEALATRHGVAMPQDILVTLLKRATKQKYLTREAGRYRRNPSSELPPSKVAEEKKQIRANQARLVLLCYKVDSFSQI